MRNLGEQWIENGRMYKAVLQESKIINRVIDGNICHGCCHVDNWDDDCLHPSQLCPLDKGLIVKDLGPVNEDGLLPCPFCGKYPFVYKEEMIGYDGGSDYMEYSVLHKCSDNTGVACTTERRSEQEAIDTWNRRAM